MKSHSPYCEATGPIVDEGFVAARIRDLQRVYHQKRMSTQSHSPMSPCPIYPKLQKYESFSRAGPYESLVGSSPTGTVASDTPRSLRQNRVSAGYLSNPGNFKAWNRSTDDLDQSKFPWPRYRKQMGKGYSASSSNLNDSVEEQVISTPLRASDRKEHGPQIERRLLPKSNQALHGHQVETPKSGLGVESTATSRSVANQKNSFKEGLGLRDYVPSANVQPTEQQRISETLQDTLVDAVPFQVAGIPLSSLEDSEYPSPSARGAAKQLTGEHVTSTLPPKIQRNSRPKGYGDLNRGLAPLTDASRFGSEADNGLHAEAPSGIFSNPTNKPNRARQANPRRQSLPAKLGGSNRRPSSASTKTSSAASSTRSSSLWKKWRSWKLVLVDKPPSIQDLSDGPRELSLSSANEVGNLPPETKQANLDQQSSSSYMQPTHKTTRPNRNFSVISRRAEEVGGRKARFSVEIIPQTQIRHPRTQEVLGKGTSRAAIPPNITVNVPATTPQQQPFGTTIATLPLDEDEPSLPDSKGTSLFRAGGRDDFAELTDSTDSTSKIGRKVKKIQVVVSFDEVADLVIEARLNGKKEKAMQ